MHNKKTYIGKQLSNQKLKLNQYSNWSVTRLSNVSELLNAHLHCSLDGNSYTVQKLLNEIPSYQKEVIISNNEHEAEFNVLLAEVNELAEKIRVGWILNPIILDQNGRVSVGLLELIAYSLTGIEWVKVIDFSQLGLSQLLQLTQQHYVELSSVFSNTLLSPPGIELIRGKFQSSKGYNHGIIYDIFDNHFATQCYEEIQNLSWKRQETDFFLQNEFVVKKNALTLPPSLSRLAELVSKESFLIFIKQLTGNTLLTTPEIVIHQLKEGDYIDPHNDLMPEGHRLRCVICLGPEERNKLDGAFLVLGSETRQDVLNIYSHTHNSMIIFQIGPESFHMVTSVQKVKRYTIILSFYEELKPNLP